MIGGLVDRFGRWLTNRKMRSYGPHAADDTAVIVLAGQRDLIDGPSAWSDICEMPVDGGRLAGFLRRAREAGWAVFHVPIQAPAPGLETALSQTHFLKLLQENALLQPGTPGAEISESLRDPGDVVLPPRARLNGFYDSDLDAQLQAKGITRLIIAGGLVNADTDSTARMGVELDYDVTVLSDTVAALTATDREMALTVTLPRLVARIMDTTAVLGR